MLSANSSKKLVRSVISFLVVLFVAGGFSFKACAQPIMAVVGVTNTTGRYLPGIEEAAGEMLNVLLVESGKVTLVERSKLSEIITEQKYALTGLMDLDQSSVQLGRLLGAEYLVTGSITSFDQETTYFRGYGISTAKVVSQMSVSLRVLDVNTGSISFATSFSSSHQENQTKGHHTSSVNRALLRKSMDGAVRRLVDELGQSAMDSVSEVMVYIDSTPQGAEILVDGIYYGDTPFIIPLAPGLCQVAISYPGYARWLREVNAFDGLHINAVLQPD